MTQECDVTLEHEEVLDSSRFEEKASRSLLSTPAAMRSSLDKAKILVETGRRTFDADWMVHDAAINTVIQLAEEAKRLPRSFREERGGIAWHQLIGMRNIVAHEYVDVDISTVWIVLRDECPRVERILFPNDV